ncbi:MAG: hypothetical protein RI972_2308 [Pseudomonadota bacterium]
MLTVLITRITQGLPPAALAFSLAAALGAVAMAGPALAQGAAFTPAPAPAVPQAKPPTVSDPATARALRQLFDEEWERRMRQNPEEAAYFGDRRGAQGWTDLSLQAIAAREAADRAALQRLRAIARQKLSPADQLHYDTFAWLQQEAVRRQDFKEHLQPVGHQSGPQTADRIGELLRFSSAADYRLYIHRLSALPRYLEQHIALMREGVKAGLVPPKVLMQRVPAQIAAQVVQDPKASPFYRPFKRMAASLAADEGQALALEAQAVIRDQVVPAYQAFGRYFLEEYLPSCREDIAATARPDGAAYYEFLARAYTTTTLSAEDIHQTGLAEVARIRAEMERVKAQTGFQGSLEAFFTFLRTDPRFYKQTPAELLAAYEAVSKRIDPQMVKVFRKLPRLPYGVRPIPDHQAPDTTTAYYQPGANDGSRAGFYYVNLYRPEMRPTWEMVPLTLHEAVPGHHHQFALGLELADAPTFRRTAYFVAYGEGWGLYAEQLGYDMGLYDDPYDRFGQLVYEMWRAVRLVVDTGMHAKGWSRERAIAYFRANAAKTEQDIVNEIDRYIGTPGQALAYKIGQLRISGLRRQAEQALGDRFDVRDFNDAVLSTGSVPLAVLEAHMAAWIAAQRRP